MRKIKLTFDVCKNIALECRSRSEFKKLYPSSYGKSLKEGWLDSICSHMEIKKVNKNYWTFENCQKEALKYKSRGEFSKRRGWAYQTALNNDWLDSICKHMEINGNLKKRCIYAYEFSNNIVYVGLTYNFEKRWVTRLQDEKDVVNQFIKNNDGELPKRIRLTEYVEIHEAQKLEKKYLTEYVNNGWVCLNKVKTGSLGGKIVKWTRFECINEIKKYKTLVELRKHNINCLSAIYKNKWFDILEILEKIKHKNNFWSKEKCLAVVRLCNTKTEFYKKYRGAYASAKKNGWFDEIIKNIKNDRL